MFAIPVREPGQIREWVRDLMLFGSAAYRIQLNSVQSGETTMSDGGSTPQQYGLPAGATELQDLIEYREMNFALGNIFKACYRRGTCSHSDELRDMRKILWFAQREIVRLEGKRVSAVMDPEGLSSLQPPSSAEKLMKRYPPAKATMPLDENAGDQEDKQTFRRFAPGNPYV